MLLFLGLIATLAPLYQLVPDDTAPPLGINFWSLGAIDCLAASQSIVCESAGLPVGHRMSFGLPFATAAALISLLPGIDTLAGFQLCLALCLCASILAFVLIGRELGLGLPASLGAAWLYLSLPITYAKANYGFLMFGFVLAPVSIAVDLWFFRLPNSRAGGSHLTHPRRSDRSANSPMADGRRPHAILGALVLLVTKIVLLLGEPYSFVVTTVFTATAAIVFAAQTKAGRTWRASWKTLWRPAWSACCVLVAVAVYRLYLPEVPGYTGTPIDFFRGQGIDLAAFFMRLSPLYAFPNWTSLESADPLRFYTDGEMVQNSFVGFSLSVAVIAYLWLARREGGHRWSLLGAALLCFVASLGPSLKIDDQQPPPGTDDRLIGHGEVQQLLYPDYQMPAEAATLEFPWAPLYSWIPGVNAMRAVSRWHLMFELTAALAAMTLAVHLARRRGLVFGLLLGGFLALLVVEHFPSVAAQVRSGLELAKHLERFDDQVVDELSGLIEDGETVAFVGPDLTAEYLTIYLCARAGCRCYNSSTDKALLRAEDHWPATIRTLLREPTATRVSAALAATELEAVIVPHFDLRWDSYQWPADAAPRADRLGFADGLAPQTSTVQRSRWFSVIREQ